MNFYDRAAKSQTWIQDEISELPSIETWLATHPNRTRRQAIAALIRRAENIVKRSWLYRNAQTDQDYRDAYEHMNRYQDSLS